MTKILIDQSDFNHKNSDLKINENNKLTFGKSPGRDTCTS